MIVSSTLKIIQAVQDIGRLLLSIAMPIPLLVERPAISNDKSYLKSHSNCSQSLICIPAGLLSVIV